ncbi:MAG: S28 family serine protease, partial [Bacteriovoracia bacterium]
GSYAASLAAYYRQKYPQNVVGALASSGPVQAKAAFEEYDLTVFTVAGSDCVANMRKVVAAAEKAMADAETAQAFKTRFQAQEVREAIDFLYVIADQASIAVQYGKRDEFCAALEEAGDDLQALIDAYAKKGKEMFDWFGITAVQDSYQGSESLDAADYEEGVGMRQWVYQTCSEYGYFQVAYRDPAKSARSSRITLPYHFEVCERLFGLKKPLDEKLTNEKYYLPLLNEKDAATKNILLTNGANDPWAMLSITKELGNDTNPNLLSLMIPGASHCEDLTSRMGTELEKVRDLTLALFQKWVARE